MRNLTKIATGIALALAVGAGGAMAGNGNSKGNPGKGSRGASAQSAQGMRGGGWQSNQRGMSARRANADARDNGNGNGPPFTKFNSVDTDRDGRLSSDEVAAQTDISADLETFDADADGEITKREYARYKNSVARQHNKFDDDDGD